MMVVEKRSNAQPRNKMFRVGGGRGARLCFTLAVLLTPPKARADVSYAPGESVLQIGRIDRAEEEAAAAAAKKAKIDAR